MIMGKLGVRASGRTMYRYKKGVWAIHVEQSGEIPPGSETGWLAGWHPQRAN